MGSVIQNEKTRKYIYAVIAAVIPVVVAVGLITEEQAVTVGSSVLGLASALLAVPNTKANEYAPDADYDAPDSEYDIDGDYEEDSLDAGKL